jgi:DNA-binding response OmpR family regulator
MTAKSAVVVLVVDDDDSLRMLCRVNLELDGYQVVEAPTLPDARAALAAGAIEVVLLDIHVAGEDGRTLLRELREQGPRPAVALFTGSSSIGEEERALADAVLPKPFELGDLQATVRRLAGV